ncbi:linker for activation of T-cells family member 2 isoform X3 [Artibeus jamaicensis]|uniref:linker for activation of T-cells family member 2 isoform X3 n=1 Tax=Artibeus jamaicensis TaxID=9417 RepID=UPI00235A8D93|nr:linker for activation of T-cells family member 2 isoform X3 [Artibeus jamaicensis]
MPFCSLPLFVSFSPSRSLCLSCVCAHACVSVSFTAEPVRQGSGCVRDDSVADRKPARLACCPQVSVALVSAPAGVWAQDEVAAVKSFQLSGCSFPCPFHWNRDSGQSRWSRPTMPHPALEPQGKWPGAGMNAETELLWPGAALLLLLGAVAASLCVRCSRSGVKRSEKICEQRNLPEDQQNFSGAWTYSLARPMVDRASNMAAARKDKLLQFSPSLEGSASPRYQNFRKGSRLGSNAVYIDPTPMDCYIWEQFQKPQEADDDDDANSYENVLICKQKQPDSGDEESEDYQNSASIQQWQESRRVVGKGPRGAPPCPAGSPDKDDEEPDYVNGDVAAAEA